MDIVEIYGGKRGKEVEKCEKSEWIGGEERIWYKFDLS